MVSIPTQKKLKYHIKSFQQTLKLIMILNLVKIVNKKQISTSI